MHIELRPDELAPPAANYAHAVLSTSVERTLHTSGIVPTRADGTVPHTIAEQAERVWEILLVLLRDADMAPSDVVSITTYVVDGEPLDDVMAARDEVLGGHRAASTLVVVPKLAQPQWKMEIALVAAR